MSRYMDRANQSVVELRAELGASVEPAAWNAVAVRLIAALLTAIDYDGARALTAELTKRTRRDRELAIAAHLALADTLFPQHYDREGIVQVRAALELAGADPTPARWIELAVR